MLISLSEIMNQPGVTKEFTCEYTKDTFTFEGNTYKITEKNDINLVIKNLGGKKVSIKASGRFGFTAPCDRCLEEQHFYVPVDFEAEIDMNKSSKERAQDLDDTEYIIGYDLDVDRLVYEELLIGFPVKILCSEDCKGICSVCGANLNKGECGCDRTIPDPRMSAIRDMFKPREVV